MLTLDGFTMYCKITVLIVREHYALSKFITLHNFSKHYTTKPYLENFLCTESSLGLYKPEHLVINQMLFDFRIRWVYVPLAEKVHTFVCIYILENSIYYFHIVMHLVTRHRVWIGNWIY
jgi:hypothetical protein